MFFVDPNVYKKMNVAAASNFTSITSVSKEDYDNTCIVKSFTYEDKTLRMVILREPDEDHSFYFMAKDSLALLGYNIEHHVSRTLQQHVSDHDRLTFTDLMKKAAYFKGGAMGDTMEGIPLKFQPHTTFLTESGFYSLIMRSSLPSAIKIRDWVTSDVLPSIRRTGTYSVPTPEVEVASATPEVNIVNMDMVDVEEEKFVLVKPLTLTAANYIQLVLSKERAEQQLEEYKQRMEEYKQRMEKYEEMLFNRSNGQYEQEEEENVLVPKSIVISRKCSGCKQVKMAEHFYRDRSQSGGLSYKCIECIKAGKQNKKKNSANTIVNVNITK